jgi:hypothetical protein
MIEWWLWGGESMEIYYLIGMELPFYKMKRVTKMDDGDRCTTYECI